MHKLLVAMVASLLVFGCGKNKAVKAAEDMADTVCACKDAACAEQAAKTGQAALMGMANERGTESDGKAILAAMERMQSCLTKLTSAAPSDVPPTR
jgi:hypothetical protein